MLDHARRVPTSVAGLDTILGGGLFHGSVYLVTGQPGSGKTILGNQICFAHARAGGKVVYCTLLAETHGRMLANLSTLSFFDERLVGDAITYLEGFGILDKDGLDGAMKLLRSAVRDHHASLLIIDGTVTAERMSPSDVAYKRFIQELKSWVEVIDCTVVLLTSSGGDPEHVVKPEHTMVDGIVQLANRHLGMRLVRELCVRKFRGSSHVEGFHSYTITGDGIVVWPRIEAQFREVSPGRASDEIVPLGVAGLDAMLDGGVRRDSLTLVVGATGVGKTMLSLQFLRDGVSKGERCLYFGLFEDPSLTTTIARRLGIGDDEREAQLSIIWQLDTERVLDALGADLLRALETTGARRLVIDGMVAFKTAATEIERLPGFFAALSNVLRRRGVTTLFTEELHDVVGGPLHVPIENIAANCDNILFLRQLERKGRMVRLLSVVKTRGSRHDRTPYPFDVTAKGVVLEGPRPRTRGGSAQRGAAKRKRRR